MTFDWWTFALQTINFLVLVWLLQRLLYKPVLGVIARRKTLVEEAFAEAEASKQAAEAEKARFEHNQSELAQARQELLSRTHAEIETDRARMIEEARAHATRLMDESRERLAAERTALIEQVRAELAELAVQMAASLLDEVRTKGADQALWSQTFRTQMLKRIADLPDEERTALQGDLATDESPLLIVTSDALSDSEQQQWRQSMDQSFSANVKITFVVEPALLGGVELRFPHAVLSLAWSGMLHRGRARLLTHDNAD